MMLLIMEHSDEEDSQYTHIGVAAISISKEGVIAIHKDGKEDRLLHPSKDGPLFITYG